MSQIPNIIHFICIKPLEFKFIHYLAVSSAYHVHKPDVIYLYADEEPDGFYWDCVKDYVTLEIIVPPEESCGTHIHNPEYKADVIRIEKLIEKGGIYMDIDNISINSLEKYRHHDIVMSAQVEDEYKDQDDVDINNVKVISNSVIMAKPGSQFFKDWLSIMGNYFYRDYHWAYHAVCLPRDMLKENNKYRKGVKLINFDKYMGAINFNLFDPFIFHSWQVDRIKEFDNCFTMIFYQALVGKRYLKNITPVYMKTHDNIFTRLFEHHLNWLEEKADLLSNKLYELYCIKDWDNLEFYASVYALCNMKGTLRQEFTAKFYLAYAKQHLKKDDYKDIYKELMDNNLVDEDIKSWSSCNYNI